MGRLVAKWVVLIAGKQLYNHELINDNSVGQAG